MRETVEMLFAEGWLMKIESWIETVHPGQYGVRATLGPCYDAAPGTPPAARVYNRGLSYVCIGVARCRNEVARTRARRRQAAGVTGGGVAEMQIGFTALIILRYTTAQ